MEPNDDQIVENDSSVALSVHEHRVKSSKEEAAPEQRKTLARNETKAVNYLRAAVFLFLAVTAVLVCVGVFIFTRNDEIDDFGKS